MKSLPKLARDITGKQFGRLTVVSYFGASPGGRGSVWLCRCACGNEKHILSGQLHRGTSSCGCLNKDVQRARLTKHSRSRTSAYRIWSTLRQRCTNPNNTQFKNYGARGIKVCDRWLASFEDFAADMGPRPDGGEIERIDNNGNYEPGNCRWASRKEQCRNTRRTRFLTHNGETLCVTEWAERLGVHPVTLHLRLKKGWSVEKTVTTPPLKRQA